MEKLCDFSYLPSIVNDALKNRTLPQPWTPATRTHGQRNESLWIITHRPMLLNPFVDSQADGDKPGSLSSTTGNPTSFNNDSRHHACDVGLLWETSGLYAGSYILGDCTGKNAKARVYHGTLTQKQVRVMMEYFWQGVLPSHNNPFSGWTPNSAQGRQWLHYGARRSKDRR